MESMFYDGALPAKQKSEQRVLIKPRMTARLLFIAIKHAGVFGSA
jgi:hypothetical protein